MAELFGRVDGCSKGRGGSMHMFDLERRFMGGYGIVGGNLPIATGLALGSDYKETEDAVLCQFGDGAANQGTFGEALNLAALWKLPVVFMVTNNQFGMGTALERHSAVTDLHKRGDGFGVPGMRCDGMDVLDTYAVTSEALKKAREDRQPVLVEAITYRFRGHSMADPEEYRTKEQVEEWRKRDPLTSFGERLVKEEVLTEDDIEELDREAIAAVDEAVRFADDSPHPEPESLYDNVYVLGDQVRGWYSVDERAAGVHRGEDEREQSQDGARREQFEAVVESQSGDIGDAGSGPSDSAKDSGKDEEAPEEAEDTEDKEDVEDKEEAEA
jgi:pyruvate dehydrogenase E1 component alpha subunit